MPTYLFENVKQKTQNEKTYSGISPIVVDNEANKISVNKATSESEGVVKPDGTTITINDGVISATGGGEPYTLPPATSDTLGGVKISTGLSITEDGTLSATGVGVEIINNLTDTSTDKALSANMGKTLNDSKQDKLTPSDGIIIEKNDEGETLIKDKALRFPNQGYTLPNSSDRKNSVLTFNNSGNVDLAKIWNFDNWRNIRIAADEPLTDVDIVLPGPDERKGKVIGFADDNGKQIEMKETPSQYILPVATANTLGGVKISDDFEITSDGKMSIASIKWAVNNLPSAQNWCSVCYGNGKFVAISKGSDKAAYSTDGINWAETALPAAVNWQKVCYGNGRFVSISGVYLAADVLVFAYSNDGIEWKEANVSGLGRDRFSAVAFGNGVFVAISYLDHVAAYSTDGINWQRVYLPALGDFEDTFASICFGAGKFVALSSLKSVAIYSTDGLNWQKTSLPVLGDFKSVCYGAGKFVAVANYSTRTIYSEDGITWTESSLPTSRSWFSVCYGNGKFIAISYGEIAAYSVDGINWTEFELPESANWRDICYNEKFVAVASSSNKALCGISASAKVYAGIAPIVVDNEANKISVNKATSETEGVVKPDGTTITINDGVISATGGGEPYTLPPATSNTLGGVKISTGLSITEDGTLSATGVGVEIINNLTDTSTDKALSANMGKTLNDSKQDKLTAGDNITISADNVISATGGGSYTLPIAGTSVLGGIKIGDDFDITEDGVLLLKKKPAKYKIVNFPIQAAWYAAYGAGKFVAVSSKNKAAVSYNGIDWEEFNLPEAEFWNTIAYGNGRFVASTSQSNTVAWSSDGMTWNKVDKPSACYNTFRMCYCNGKFMCCSLSSKVIMVSENGSQWNTISKPDDISEIVNLNGKILGMRSGSPSNLVSWLEDDGTWTDITLPVEQVWCSACQNNGTILAVGYGYNETASSNKAVLLNGGSEWQTITLPLEQTWLFTSYISGKYLALGNSKLTLPTDILAISSNGLEWSSAQLPLSAVWNGICIGNGKFLLTTFNNSNGLLCEFDE